MLAKPLEAHVLRHDFKQYVPATARQTLAERRGGCQAEIEADDDR